MKKRWAGVEYSTEQVSDPSEGWTALELRGRRGEGEERSVARVVFWDADGQLTLEMPADEAPLAIIEELIAEARSVIRVG